MYRVNVSAVNTFSQCRFRWWCEYVMNRVPVATSPALDGGRLLHRIFERHFRDGTPLLVASQIECKAYRAQIPAAHPAARANAEKAVQQVEDVSEAFPLWHDKFRYDETLEVEQAHEWPDPILDGVTWMLRPDRIVRAGTRRLHVQNRGLAAGINFGMYTRLAKRHYHEHLYAEALNLKGTVFNLVRKLKFRTYAGTAREAVKTADEMFFQSVVTVGQPTHAAVMAALRQHVTEMMRAEKEWRQYGVVPAPNEKMNGGYGGNSEDPYFKLLIGEVTLDDEDVFKDREDPYAEVPSE